MTSALVVTDSGHWSLNCPAPGCCRQGIWVKRASLIPLLTGPPRTVEVGEEENAVGLNCDPLLCQALEHLSL